MKKLSKLVWVLARALANQTQYRTEREVIRAAMQDLGIEEELYTQIWNHIEDDLAAGRLGQTRLLRTLKD